MEQERFRRLRELVRMFHDAGLQPVHENCMNYGGMGYPFTLRLVENVPGLKLVFDTGNPVFSDDRTKPAPYPRQDGWEFYSRVKEHIAYVHIKDGVWDGASQQMHYAFPGEGDGQVRRVVQDLVDCGYDGGFSMEPHMKVVPHEPSQASEASARFDLCVEYGRRFMRLLAEVRRPCCS
jgi:sugar phosphate isomerase/epimerase